MTLFILFYITRLIISIFIGFLQASNYDSDRENSDWYKGNKSMIYLKRKNFLIWMIPIYGWVWLLVYQIKTGLKVINFFNE